MSVYSRDDEERIDVQRQVRAWTAAGLLGTAQGDALAAALRTDLRRTNLALRAVLALFTAVIAAASIGLVFVVFNINGAASSAITLLVAAGCCAAAADALAVRVRLYRHGVEEALAMAAVVAAALAVVALRIGRGDLWAVSTLAVAAAASHGVYRRFGFVYMLIGAAGCAALIPLQLPASGGVRRLCAAAVCAAIFLIARRQRRAPGDAHPGNDYASLEAAAALGIYLAANLFVWDGWLFGVNAISTERWFRWASYGAIWVLPAAGIFLGVRERERLMLDVGIGTTLATLVTHKTYLGWPRHSWDPMLLGAVMIAAAVTLRRWLASGPDGARAGFSGERVRGREADMLSAVAQASALVHPHAAGAEPVRSGADRSSDLFEGGRSGGGGASGKF